MEVRSYCKDVMQSKRYLKTKHGSKFDLLSQTKARIAVLTYTCKNEESNLQVM